MIDAERLLEILMLEPSVKSKAEAPSLAVHAGKVSFENVHFAYDDRKPAVEGLSLDVKSGSKVAFVGETGAGKSTLLRLLFRFYDVQKGSIKIDGMDIRDVSLDSLRSAIGVVPQDPSMFNDTIMNNLRYANFDATDLGMTFAIGVIMDYLIALTFR
jgi:ABC-type transport system involved in Fe-S cluster assembly fused permease/ATPase subunit